ncbi:MAG: aldose 1-epimerase family protein [Eubacteriales bacterium]
MIYTIENDYLTAKISDVGAELISLKSKRDECEYIWQGDEKYWTGHAPIMFPICGRLFGGKYTYRGKEYEMPIHGIVRHEEFALKSASASEITLEYASNEKSRTMYPFDFVFDVTFKLMLKSVEVKFNVKNTGGNDLIFAVGGHPAFNVPLGKSGKFEDYYLEFDKKCAALRVDFSDTCFCTGNDRQFTEGGTKRIPLTHDLFDNDAIFLYNTDKNVTLASEGAKNSVTVSFDGMKYVGIWHKPKTDAPYVCIEPWSSIPSYDGAVDDLESKEQMVHLPSSYSYKNSFMITVN